MDRRHYLGLVTMLGLLDENYVNYDSYDNYDNYDYY